MKTFGIVLLMFIPLLFSNCDGSVQIPDTNNESVTVYMDYSSVEISKSSISEVLEFDGEVVDVVEKENVFAITGKKEGSTTLQVKDERGKKKMILVSVHLALNVNRWCFDDYSVDIDCTDPKIHDEIMADLKNHIIQSRVSDKKSSSIIFKTANTFELELCSDDNVQTLKGTYSYDLSNLVLTISSSEVMTCLFSINEELPMSWDATLIHDLTESYKAMYPNEVKKVMVNYSISTAKILLGNA